MKNIYEAIELEKQRLHSIVFNDGTIDYLNQFYSDIYSFIEYDPLDIITIFYIIRKDVSINDAAKKIKFCQPFLDEIFKLEYDEIYDLSDMFSDAQALYGDKLGECKYHDYLKLKSEDSKYLILKELLNQYRDYRSEEEINEFINWMNDEQLADIICFAAAVRESHRIVENNIREVEMISLPSSDANKLAKNMSGNYVKNLNESYLKKMAQTFKKELDDLKIFKEKKRQEAVTLKKKTNKRLKDLEFLEKSLKDGTLRLETLNKYKLDTEFLNLIVIELIKIRNEEFKTRYQELMKCRENPINQLEILFDKFGYNFNSLLETEREELSKQSITKIEENLHFFQNSSLSFIKEQDECFINILMLDTDILLQIDSLLKREKITPDFILEYGNLFDTQIIKVLAQNINKLDVQKINFVTLSNYNKEILFKLNNNILDLLVLYGINLKSENITHFEFLENAKLINIIDRFIEIGLLVQIQQLPNLITKYSNTIIKRIMLMQEIEQNYLNSINTLNQTARSGKEFPISDDELDEYVDENSNIYMDNTALELLDSSENLKILEVIPEEISFIESYKKSDQVYMIGENYFSRIKVLRCLTTLIDAGYTDYKNILFQSLIYNYPKHLSLETIEQLKNISNYIPRKQLI